MINKQSPGSFPVSFYLAKPKSSLGKGVLVLPAWWGLNGFIRNLCDRFADVGYLALAPDLYHGAIAVTIEEAKRLRSKLKQDIVVHEITQANEILRNECVGDEKRIGLVGFSLGGYWGLWLANQPTSSIAASVIFYGTRNGDYSGCDSAFQFHFAQTDEYVEESAVKKLQKNLKTASKPATFYTYPGTSHWFFENDRPDAYEPAAAALAWNRTVEFLNKYL